MHGQVRRDEAKDRRQSDAAYEEQHDFVTGAEGVGRQVRKQIGERSRFQESGYQSEGYMTWTSSSRRQLSRSLSVHSLVRIIVKILVTRRLDDCKLRLYLTRNPSSSCS